MMTFKIVPPLTGRTEKLAQVIGLRFGCLRNLPPLIRFQIFPVSTPKGRRIRNHWQVWKKLKLCPHFTLLTLRHNRISWRVEKIVASNRGYAQVPLIKKLSLEKVRFFETLAGAVENRGPRCRAWDCARLSIWHSAVPAHLDVQRQRA